MAAFSAASSRVAVDRAEVEHDRQLLARLQRSARSSSGRTGRPSPERQPQPSFVAITLASHRANPADSSPAVTNSASGAAPAPPLLCRPRRTARGPGRSIDCPVARRSRVAMSTGTGGSPSSSMPRCSRRRVPASIEERDHVADVHRVRARLDERRHDAREPSAPRRPRPGRRRVRPRSSGRTASRGPRPSGPCRSRRRSPDRRRPRRGGGGSRPRACGAAPRPPSRRRGRFGSRGHDLGDGVSPPAARPRPESGGPGRSGSRRPAAGIRRLEIRSRAMSAAASATGVEGSHVTGGRRTIAPTSW